MKTILTVSLFFLYSFTYAQFSTIGEYSFTSTANYFGKIEHLTDDAVTISDSKIQIVGTSEGYKSIKKITEFDPYSYGFTNATTDEEGRGVWICSDANYNKGLLKVIYDPKRMIIEFQFKDGTSQIFFKVKRVK